MRGILGVGTADLSHLRIQGCGLETRVAALETTWLGRPGLRVTAGRDCKTRLNLCPLLWEKQSLWMSVTLDSKCFHKIQIRLSENKAPNFLGKVTSNCIPLQKKKKSEIDKVLVNQAGLSYRYDMICFVLSYLGGRGNCMVWNWEGKKVTQSHSLILLDWIWE